MLGLAIFLGGVIGVLVTFFVGSIKISLSTSVGTLLAGLAVGYLSSRNPLFGRIPEGAITLMTSRGLAAFVPLTGIHAGPTFLSALREAGIGLLLGGMAVTLLPQVIGLFFGDFVLRMNPSLLLGALTGGQTVTAAMAAVQEHSGSSSRGPELRAGIPGREYRPDDLGHDYGSCHRRLNWERGTV